MTCLEVQKNMKAFSEDSLSTARLEEFLRHIKTCQSCREDLEVYYTIYESIKLLEEDKNTDYQVDVHRKLRRTEDMLRRRHRRTFAKKVIFAVLSLLLCLLLEK